MPAEAAAQLLPASRGGLPDWADRFLAAPPAGEFFASRAWFDTVLAHALPPDAVPVLARAVGDSALVPLLRQGSRLRALTTPYSLDFRPLLAPGADPEAAGASFGRALRLRPPVSFDLLDPAAPGLAGFKKGLAAAGIRAMAYDHVGNWYQVLAPGDDWDSYLPARPPALRTTIGRKLKRVGRELRFGCIATPGDELEAGIAAYETVRAASWKPHEPFPDFDRHLLRAAAAAGVLRLGVLSATDSQPVAAQYWIIDRGGSRATVLKLAHAEAAKAASPGTVLTALMIRKLIEEDFVRELDFGRGDDEYKQLWAGTRRQRIGLILADPRHPAGLLAIARQAMGAVRRRRSAT